MSLFERFRGWLQDPIAGRVPVPPAPPAPPPAAEPDPPVLTDVVQAPSLSGPVRMDRLQAQLVLHEGYRRIRYRDSEGHWTIGIGRNLDAKPFNARERLAIGARNLDSEGLSYAEVMMLFRRDVAEAIAELDRHLPWWRGQDEIRRRVLLDMMFNMGPGDRERGLLSFVNTLAHIQAGRYDQAAAGMAASKWARQTKTRADRLIEMMRTGKDWTK